MTEYMRIDFQKDSPAHFEFDELDYYLSQDQVACLIEDGVLLLAGEQSHFYGCRRCQSCFHSYSPPPDTCSSCQRSISHLYGCHRCRRSFYASYRPTTCRGCHSETWNTYTLLYCCHCHALFEYYWHLLGESHPYDRFPKCPACKSENWCPAENERLRDLPKQEETQAPAQVEVQGAAITQAEVFYQSQESKTPRSYTPPLVSEATTPTALVRAYPSRTAEEWVRAGKEHFYYKRYSEALAAIEVAIRLDFWPAYHIKGDMLRDLKRYEEALSFYEQHIPYDSFLHRYKGDVLRDLKRYEEALNDYEQAIRLDPKSGFTYAQKGDILCDLERYEEALTAYEQALCLDPKSALASSGKKKVLQRLNGSKAQQPSQASEPYEALGYDKQGTALYVQERYEEALNSYEQAIRLDPDGTFAYIGKGNVLTALKRYEEALTAYEQAIRLYPSDARASIGKGNVLTVLKRYEEALSAYEQAIRLDPTNDQARAARSKVEASRKQEAEARLKIFTEQEKRKREQRIAEMKAAQEKAHAEVETLQRTAEQWLQEGDKYGEEKNYQKSLTSYEQALRLAPNDVRTWVGKGLALAGLKRYEESLAAYEQALCLNPHHTAASSGKEVVLQKLNRPKVQQPAQASKSVDPKASHQVTQAPPRASLAQQQAGPSFVPLIILGMVLLFFAILGLMTLPWGIILMLPALGLLLGILIRISK